MNNQNHLQQLICGTKDYAWGIPGSDPQCLVYKYASKSHQNYNLNETLDPQKPWAELWMGKHPSLSSKFLSTNQPLSENNSINFPFLFKVLSVNKALSIQAHPNKQQAIILNKYDTKNYPDNNHKPEMAISLGVFETLSGIAPKERIIENFERNKRLIECLGQKQWDEFKSDQNADIKQIIMKILNFQEDQLKYILQCLILPFNSPCNSIYELQSQYPNDVGLIFVLLLNHIRLELGEALIMGAGQLHAYLKGNCLECMANSDNVVRAGFTEKYKDKITLCDIMIPEMMEAQKVKPEVKKFESYSISKYLTPFEEFQCVKIQIESKIEEQEINIERQSILICTEGKMILKVNDQTQNVGIGDCYLIRENSQLFFYSDEESVIFICTSQ